MFAIVGAAGNVGFSTSSKLRETGVPVRAIVRNEAKASQLNAIGCELAFADLHDAVALQRAMAGAEAVQVILPPPPRADDAVGEMRQLIENLAHALEQAQPERVLVISDYGAHVTKWIGMPSVYRSFEQRVRVLGMNKVILRSAEHMQGWGAFVPVAATIGALPTLHHPTDGAFPTISAPDLGGIAADLLLHPEDWRGDRTLHAEGPRHYSADDVAAALSDLLGRTITARFLPRSQWQQSLERVLSPSASKLLIELYEAHNEGSLVVVEPGGQIVRGATEMIDALRPFVSRSPQ